MSDVQLKPLIPWMGGKRKLIKTILPLIPEYNGIYFECFVGAGAIFLAHQPKKAVISDINPDIINMWKQIKFFPKKLISSLTSHEITKEHWDKCNKQFPKLKQGTLKRCSYFCYLVAYGFGGLYKLRSDGSFLNTFTSGIKGKNKGKPFKQQIENIKNISDYLNKNKIKIICQDYGKVINKCKKGDFVYLDPPYVSKAKSTKLMYTEDDFNHEELCENYKDLSKKGVYCMLSNVNSKIIIEPLKQYKIKKIKLKIQWTLNGNVKIKDKKGKKNTSRNEILIMNYNKKRN
jgi:DNA adenine methylase